MSLGSSDMAQSALGTVFSLLLLAGVIQGLEDLEVVHYEKMEAVEGQNVTLPCTLKNSTNLHVSSIEWSKNRKRNTKIALYNALHGEHLFSPNVTIEIEKNTTGSYLHLYGVTKWNSDIYICDLTTYPLGIIRRETELTVKDVDVKLKCDAESPIEVRVGENVTIHCTKIPNAQYRWTKNEELVSVSASLELPRVADAHGGVYLLNLKTGNKTLQKNFIITVLTATTSIQIDVATVTEKSANSIFTTSPTTEHSTIYTDATWTRSMTTDIKNPNHMTITPGENVTSYTDYTETSVKSSPVTSADPKHFSNSSNQDISPTPILNPFSDQPVASNRSEHYGGIAFNTTEEMRNDSMLHTVQPEVNIPTRAEEFSSLASVTEIADNPDATPVLNTGIVINNEDGARGHFLLVLLIVPVLLLIAVAGTLYRKQVKKQRMDDLPPPFKPPPPPVKYTGARYSERTIHSFSS